MLIAQIVLPTVIFNFCNSFCNSSYTMIIIANIRHSFLTTTCNIEQWRDVQSRNPKINASIVAPSPLSRDCQRIKTFCTRHFTKRSSYRTVYLPILYDWYLKHHRGYSQNGKGLLRSIFCWVKLPAHERTHALRQHPVHVRAHSVSVYSLRRTSYRSLPRIKKKRESIFVPTKNSDASILLPRALPLHHCLQVFYRLRGRYVNFEENTRHLYLSECKNSPKSGTFRIDDQTLRNPRQAWRHRHPFDISRERERRVEWCNRRSVKCSANTWKGDCSYRRLLSLTKLRWWSIINAN